MVENYVTPGQYRHMRACMVCAVVMLHSRFLREGCPNCEEYLHLKHSSEQIDACTSPVFEGVITLANPVRSWIARWQRLDKYVPGAYAIKVSGQLPDEILAMLEEERVAYVPRDGTQNDAD